jgi:RNA-binding protein 39
MNSDSRKFAHSYESKDGQNEKSFQSRSDVTSCLGDRAVNKGTYPSTSRQPLDRHSHGEHSDLGSRSRHRRTDRLRSRSRSPNRQSRLATDSSLSNPQSSSSKFSSLERPRTPPLPAESGFALRAAEDDDLVLRDRRTVCVSQVAAKARSYDLEEHFREGGCVVKHVRFVMDRQNKYHKGVAYVEFRDEASVPRAISMNGLKLSSIPLVIQLTETEKNRQAAMRASVSTKPSVDLPHNPGYSKIKVEHLPYSTNDDLIRKIFAPIGHIEEISILRNPDGSIAGTGFVRFKQVSEATEAVARMQQYFIYGKRLRLSLVPESSSDPVAPSLSVPSTVPRIQGQFASSRSIQIRNLPPVADIRGYNLEDDLRNELGKFGSIAKVHLDHDSQTANVEYERSEDAEMAASSMNGRYFAMRRLTVEYY